MKQLRHFISFCVLFLGTSACGGLLVLDLSGGPAGSLNAPCVDGTECDLGLVCGSCGGGLCCAESPGPCSPLYPQGDCPLGELCSNGVCTVNASTPWCDCTPEEGCEDGVCVPITTSNECAWNRPQGLCPHGEICVGGQCVPCAAGGSCSSVNPTGCCPQGAVCSDGRCVADIGGDACSPTNQNGLCEVPGQLCMGGECRDQTCSPEFTNGTCPFEQVCVGGECVCVPCSPAHRDGCCADTNQFCASAGSCIDIGTCLGDGDCAGGFFCGANNECLAQGTCSDPSDCDAGFTCLNNVCERSCTTSAQCPTGRFCDGGACAPHTCTSLGCAGQFRQCDDSGAYAVCTNCITNYHEEGSVCALNDCTYLGCAAQNRECDESGAFPACGNCLSGYNEGTGGNCTNCTSTSQCAAGEYCSATGCRQDCTNNGQCGVDFECSPYGRCAATGVGASVCAAAIEEGTLVEPVVALLVDQSGSMTANYSTGVSCGDSGDCGPGESCISNECTDSRWDVLEDVLFDATSGVVFDLESKISFGLVLYTGSGGTCVDLTFELPALNNGSAMASMYAANGPESDTPTGDSIDSVTTWLNANVPASTPKYILLATDGEPDRCEELNPQDGQLESCAAALDAYNAGVPVFALSVGADVRDAHLQDVANAGQGCGFVSGPGVFDYASCKNAPNGDPTCDPGGTGNGATYHDDTGIIDCGTDSTGAQINHPFYKATNRTELVNDLNSILGSVLSCVIELDYTPGQTLISGEVWVDGDPVPQGGPDGWVIRTVNRIELLGATCDLVTNGNPHYISVAFDTCSSGG